jgi:O-antigen/teichoic acid export membrane protein
VIASAGKLLFVCIFAFGRFIRTKLALDIKKISTLIIASFPFGILIILHTFQAQLGIFILSLFDTSDAVGIYAAAHSLIFTILLVPLSVSTSISPVFSRLHVHARHDLKNFYKLCYKYLLVVGFPLGMLVALVGGEVLITVYGEEFEASVRIVRILAIFLFTLVGYCNGPFLNATGRQRFFASTQAFAVVINLGLSLLLVQSMGPVGVASAFVLSGLCTFFVHSYACHRQVQLTIPWITIGKVLIATFFMGFVIYIALWIGVHWLMVTLIIAPISYSLVILLMGIVKRAELRYFIGLPDKGWGKDESLPLELPP